MLTRVLLHVVTPPRGIDTAMHLCSCGKRRGSKMQNASVFFVCNFSDGDLLAIGGQHAEIVYLAAARGIEGGTVEHKGRPPVALERFGHSGVEVVKERIVVIKAISHREQSAIGTKQLALSARNYFKTVRLAARFFTSCNY
jgi:hypothetical protein